MIKCLVKGAVYDNHMGVGDVVNHEMNHIIHLALHLLSLFFILSFRTICDSDFWLVSLVMFAHVQLFNSSVLFYQTEVFMFSPYHV